MTQTQECFKLYASKIQMYPFIYLLTPVADQSRDMKRCSISNSQKNSQVCAHSLQQCNLNTLFHMVIENLTPSL